MLPQLDIDDLGTLPTDADLSCRDTFLMGTDVYAGCIQTAHRGDFTETGGAWSRYGGFWTGPAPVRAVPRLLRVDGATVDTTGTYPVAAVAANTGFTVLCGLNDYLRIGLVPGLRFPINIRFTLWNATTGAVVASHDAVQPGGDGEPTTVQAFAGVASGSYQLGAHLFDVYQEPITEAFYLQLTGQTRLRPDFIYQEDGVAYFWDFERHLGRLPSDSDSPLYLKRAAIVARKEHSDSPTWADYLTAGTPDEGEWSFLRIKVGGGSWTAGANISPNPGPALRVRASETVWNGVAFDTMARCISASQKVRFGNGDDILPGDYLIAGTVAMESGPVAAFWRVRAGAYTLMAWNRDPSDGKCQCAKKNHGPNGIAEKRDGTFMFLSECSRMTYDPYGLTLGDRLPAIHPGGYSLRLVE